MSVSFCEANEDINCLKIEPKKLTGEEKKEFFLLKKQNLLSIPLAWIQDAHFCPLRPFPFLSLIAWRYHGYRS